MRNGRIACGEIAGQDQIRHQCQKRVQIIHVETHRGGKGYRVAAGTGTFHVENALTHFLFTEPVEEGRRYILAAAQHMGVATGKKHCIAARKRQPFSGRFA
ncbi:hypothetical protein D3C80_1868160 [compost metagenome]